MESQEITYDEDMEVYAAAHRRCIEKLATSYFLRKKRLLEDLLNEQFSMTKLTSLEEDTAAVRQM